MSYEESETLLQLTLCRRDGQRLGPAEHENGAAGAGDPVGAGAAGARPGVTVGSCGRRGGFSDRQKRPPKGRGSQCLSQSPVMTSGLGGPESERAGAVLTEPTAESPGVVSEGTLAATSSQLQGGDCHLQDLDVAESALRLCP